MSDPTAANFVTLISVESMLAGIPQSLHAHFGDSGIPVVLVQEAIYSAEGRVERDLDILISPRKVYCVDNPGFEPPEPDAIVMPALDIPANWLAGNRQGILKLPKGFPKIIHSFKLRSTWSPSIRKFDVPVAPIERSVITVAKNSVRLKSAQWGLWLAGAGVPHYGAGGFGAGGIYRQSAGTTIPGGAEFIYTAGLSQRELNSREWRPLLSLIRIAAMIEVLTLVQPGVGGGAQKERLMTDATNNEIEYGRRDGFGAFGGDIKALQKQYDNLMRSLQSGSLKLLMLQ